MLSHSSYSSSADERGYRLRMSIDPLTSSKDPFCNTVIYKAKAFSSGGFADEEHQKKMVVKFLLNSISISETEMFAQRMKDLNTMVRNMALKFNNSMRHATRIHDDRAPVHYDSWNFLADDQSFKVQFQLLRTSQLESVSFCNRKRKKEEFFVFGPRLENPVVFVDSTRRHGGGRIARRRGSLIGLMGPRASIDTGSSNRNREMSKNGDRTRNAWFRNRSQSESSPDTTHFNDLEGGVREEADEESTPSANWCLHAFTHHFFCYTGGRVIVDRLRGAYTNEEGFTLLMPTFHSLTEEGYGPTDRGEKGIRRVIEHHRCNYFCRHLRDMQELLEETREFGELSKVSLVAFHNRDDSRAHNRS